MKGYRACALLLVLLALSFPAYSATQDRPFVLATAFEPATLDPHAKLSTDITQIVRNIYDRLVDWKPGTAEIAPAVAQSWDISPDAKTYTFRLRRGVKFTDGSPLDAAAVKFNLERAAKINLIGYESDQLNKMVETTTVADPSTLKVTLKQPFASLITLLTNIYLVNPKAIEANAGSDMGQTWLANNAVGSGPYKLQSWTRGQQLIMLRHAGHWGGWKGNHFNTVIFRFVKEESARRLMLERGEVGLAQILLHDNLDALEKTAGVKVVRSPTLVTLALYVNARKKPTDDVRVRKAMLSALNHDQVMRAMNYRVKPAKSYIPIGHWLYNPSLPPMKYDLQRAKQLLTDAKYYDNPTKLSMWYPQGQEDRRVIGEILQAALAQINVSLEITSTTFPVMSRTRTNLETGASFYPLWDNQTDPDRYYGRFVTCASVGATSWQGICNAEIDRLLARAGASTSQAERKTLFQQVEKILMDMATIVPVMVGTDNQAMRADVEGYVYTNAWNLTWDIYRMSSKR
ncbi:MAG: ABC transporter substrate-binding protein [Armatimonadetes bacterium]|nr:ABC transporter substrate-binding protein [Armatimonadota bacterium]